MNGQSDLQAAVAETLRRQSNLPGRQCLSVSDGFGSPLGSMSSMAVELAGVTKSYQGKAVVDGLSFKIAPGECFWPVRSERRRKKHDYPYDSGNDVA